MELKNTVCMPPFLEKRVLGSGIVHLGLTELVPDLCAK